MGPLCSTCPFINSSYVLVIAFLSSRSQVESQLNWSNLDQYLLKVFNGVSWAELYVAELEISLELGMQLRLAFQLRITPLSYMYKLSLNRMFLHS